jgi:hypothetical protein
MFYSPTFTKSASRIDVTLSGTSLFSGTTRVTFLQDFGGFIRYQKHTAGVGDLFVDITWKQRHGEYKDCGAFNPLTFTACRVYSTTVGDLDFRSSVGIWTPVASSPGSVTSLVFV